jgi:hypothetical protein
VIVQLCVVALLLATQGRPQPLFFVGVGQDPHAGHIPLAAFIVVEASLVVGCSLVLYSVRLIRARSRFLILVLLTTALAVPAIVQLQAMVTTSLWPQPYYATILAAWLQLVVLGILWLREIGRSLGKNLTPGGHRAALDPSPPFQVRGFSRTLVLVLLYAGLSFVGAAAYTTLGTTAGSSFISSGIWVQFIVLAFLIAGVIYWLSTDAVAWGTSIAGRIAHGSAALSSRMGRGGGAGTRRQLALIALATCAAVGVLIDAAHRYFSAPRSAQSAGLPISLRLLFIGGVVASIAFCAWLARIDHSWPIQVPRWALLVGVVAMVAFFDAAAPLAYALDTMLGLPFEATVVLAHMLDRLVIVVTLVVGLLLILQGRKRRGAQALAGLMLALVGTLLLVALITAGVLTVLLLIGAVATLSVAAWAFVKRGTGRLGSLTVLTIDLFLVLAGLEAINWYGDLTDWLGNRGEQSVVLLAGIFLILILRDVVTSGDLLTTEESRPYPRAGRVTLYFGYILIVSAIVLFAGTVHVQEGAPYGGDFASQNLSFDQLAQVGLNVLGIPLVALTLILRVGHWRTENGNVNKAPASLGAGTRWLASWMPKLAVTLAGAVILVAIAASGVAEARTVGLYSAHALGSNCDHGDALWLAEASYTCTPAGTQVTVAAHTIGSFQFIPPSQIFSQSYEIAVRADFRGLDPGCVVLEAGESSTAFNAYEVCSDSSWSILQYSTGFVPSGAPTVLAHGFAPKAQTYTIEVSIRVSDERLRINGAEVGGVSRVPLAIRECILEVRNLGSRAGFATLSDFVYTPHS